MEQTIEQKRNDEAFRNTLEITKTVRAMKFADSNIGKSVKPLMAQLGLTGFAERELANSPDKTNQMAQIFGLAQIPEENIAKFAGICEAAGKESIKSLSAEQVEKHNATEEIEEKEEESEPTAETEIEQED